MVKDRNASHLCTTVLDVGARGGIRNIFPSFVDTYRWHKCHRKGLLEYIGIEPDPQSATMLQRTGYNAVFDCALGNTNGQETLYITKLPAASSILAPDEEAIKRHWPEKNRWWLEVESTEQVKTVTLNTFCEIHALSPGIVKFDTQGSEYQIASRGNKILRNAAVVIAELTKVPYYKEQATVDTFNALMRELGYIQILAVPKPDLPFEADVLYVKEPAHIQTKEQYVSELLMLFMCREDHRLDALWEKQNIYLSKEEQLIMRDILRISPAKENAYRGSTFILQKIRRMKKRGRSTLARIMKKAMKR